MTQSRGSVNIAFEMCATDGFRSRSIRFAIGLAAVLMPTACNTAPTSNAPADYSLVWADEFDKDGLPDPKNWVYDTEANRSGWYNNELQYYAVERLENSRISAGNLVITARKEKLESASDYGGQQYSSARLITRGKASWTYGFFDVRAKLPCGAGTWPAIWMLGTAGAWPAAGEIDIMEQVGGSVLLLTDPNSSL